jgi:putative FmdB family regulatory protein
MPTYSYVCKNCAHEFEVQQSFQDQPLDTCPVCGKEVRKVFGKLGVTFKGSGFYRTDSAPKSESSSSD